MNVYLIKFEIKFAIYTDIDPSRSAAPRLFQEKVVIIVNPGHWSIMELLLLVGPLRSW